MAMTKLKLYVYPWFNGYESPQLDYIHGMVEHDAEYLNVTVQHYSNPFIQQLRGLKSKALRNTLLSIFSSVTPKYGSYVGDALCFAFRVETPKKIFF